ncbi:hypothetical protein ACX80V_11075 [Arthrobacter sp. MDT3-24]
MAAEPGEGWAVPAVRLFGGFAGFGAGSVNLAVSSSLLAEPGVSGSVWQPALAVVSGGWGAALILWTVLALHRGRIVGSGRTVAFLLTASGAHVAALAFSSDTSSLHLSHLAALLLTLMIVASAAWLKGRRLRGMDDDGMAPAAARPGILLLTAFAGAVLVAGIATPGLAASTAGQFAVPHGQHGGPAVPAGHHQR